MVTQCGAPIAHLRADCEVMMRSCHAKPTYVITITTLAIGNQAWQLGVVSRSAISMTSTLAVQF